MRNRVKDLAALHPVHAQATVLFVYWTLNLVDCDASSGQAKLFRTIPRGLHSPLCDSTYVVLCPSGR